MHTFQHSVHKSCETNLLLNLQNTVCQPRISVFFANIWNRLTPNQWLYVQTKEDTLVVQHSSGSTEQFMLPPAGIVTLDPGSTGFTCNRVLTSASYNETSIIGHLFLPDPIPVPDFHLQHLEWNWSIPKLERLDLADLQAVHNDSENVRRHATFIKKAFIELEKNEFKYTWIRVV